MKTGSGDGATMCQRVRLLSPCCESHVYVSFSHHLLESRMREIRQSGSEGGGTKSNRLSLPLLRG